MEKGPIVSVIIAAKEEEKNIVKTIRLLANQTYQNIELIIVNDRSEDETGRLVNNLKTEMDSLETIRYRVLHIDHLPAGWLGKNHALYQGYLASSGEYLLFSDADVTFQKKTISIVMKYVLEHKLEHLAMSPHFYCPTFSLRSFIHLFLFIFTLLVQPWKAFEKGKKGKGVGVGAFNLLKKSTYEKLGTHKAFALEPLDDAELGKKANAIDCNQHFVIGKELIEVEWYPTLRQAINGFRKNFFGAAGYKLSNVIGFSMLLLLCGVYPFMGLFILDGWAFSINLVSLLVLLVSYTVCIKKVSFISWGLAGEILALPATVLCYIFTLCLSAYTAVKNGGIYWRGTFYPLKDLKKAKLP